MLGLVAVAVELTDQPVSMFSRDLHALSDDAGVELPSYAGSLSILNGWVWASGAALALVAGALLPRRRRWMGLFAFLLLMLATDDALMLHEEVGPDHGVPERAFFVLYAAGCLALLLKGRRRWREHTMVAFVLGGAFLALSIGWDLVAPTHFLVEDGAKFLGALMWLTVPVLALSELAQTRPGALEGPERTEAPPATRPAVRGADGEDRMAAQPARWAASLVSRALVR